MQTYDNQLEFVYFVIQYNNFVCYQKKKMLHILKIKIPYKYLQLSIIAKSQYFYTYSFQLSKHSCRIFYLSIHHSHRINRLLIKSFNWIVSRTSKHSVKLNQERQNCIGQNGCQELQKILYPRWKIRWVNEEEGRLNARRKLFTFIERPGQENCRQDQKDHVPRQPVPHPCEVSSPPVERTKKKWIKKKSEFSFKI